MSAAAAPPPHGLARVLSWPRLRFALIASLPFGLMLSTSSVTTPPPVWVLRTLLMALTALLAFGLAERWPARPPRWLARWVLQLGAVVVAAPIGAFIAYWVTTGGDPQFAQQPLRRTGYSHLVSMGLLFMPWIAVGAMIRQREALAHEQALRFQAERGEFERQALDARLRLMQAQVQPHFLFNTLANVRALVRAGSPQAPAVLDALIAYLRAAVPRLDQPDTTLGQELELVRAYLALMHMRMPDRLQYTLNADEAAAAVRCPPMMLLTLVENAVRHGIDPSEEGGRIDVNVQLRAGRCIARVSDTGVGLQGQDAGLGTGLATLRERLQLAFGGDAQLRIAGGVPHGVSAEIEFPAQAPPVPATPGTAPAEPPAMTRPR